MDAENQHENIKDFDPSDLLNLLESVNDLVESQNTLKIDWISPSRAKEPGQQETGTT